MKIIVLGTRGFPDVQGGIEKHCEELYPRLAALGCEVTVISRAPYTGPASYMYKGVYMLPIACPKHKLMEAFFHTLGGILKARKLKCDVLHIHAIGPSIFVPLARLFGFKVVMTHHGPDYERKKWNGLAKMILKLGEKWGVKFSHQLIVISRDIFQRVREKFGREGVIIPNGVVVTERVQENGVLKHFELDQGKYFLAVGRFVPEKGFTELLESFQHLSSMGYSRWNRWKLVFVGDSDHEDKFSRDFKRKSQAVPDVVLTGFQSGKTLQELYSHAGHFVLPSYHEGLPIVLLEALSYGSSCLVSDIPANREIDLEEERYFKPGNVVQMARKLKRFIGRPVTEEERVKRIQTITDKYNWTEISQKTLDVYNGLFTF